MSAGHPPEQHDDALALQRTSLGAFDGLSDDCKGSQHRSVSAAASRSALVTSMLRRNERRLQGGVVDFERFQHAQANRTGRCIMSHPICLRQTPEEG
jgi:hypothetical protein